ncbi:MAG: ABC transporter permease [Candidatus Hermodarchaeota archaeon]
MKFSNIKTIAIKNLHQIKRDPRMIALSVIAPIIVTALFGSAFGGDLTDLKIYVVNDDDNFNNILATEIIDDMNNDLRFQFNTSTSDPTTAMEAVTKNYSQAAIIFRPTFTQNLLLGIGAKIDLFVSYVNLNTSNFIITSFQNSLHGIIQSYFGSLPVETVITPIHQGNLGSLPSIINISLVNGDLGWSLLHDKFSDAIIDTLEDDDTVNVKKVDSSSRYEAKVKKGEARAIIKFSDDFTYKLLIEGEINVKLKLDGAEPQASQAIMAALSEALSDTFEDEFDKAIYDIDEYYYNNPDANDESIENITYFTPAIIGFITFFFAFLLTMLSFLRERTQGTMERLLTSPIKRSEIIIGYIQSFSILSVIQATVTITAAVLLFNAQIVFTAIVLLQVYLIIYLLLLTALGLGILLSTLAKTEFQIIQFIPLIIMPFMLLSGVWAPVETLPEPLRRVSSIIPLTYANNAMRNIMIRGQIVFIDIIFEIGVLAGIACLMIVLGVLAFNKKLK